MQRRKVDRAHYERHSSKACPMHVYVVEGCGGESVWLGGGRWERMLFWKNGMRGDRGLWRRECMVRRWNVGEKVVFWNNGDILR